MEDSFKKHVDSLIKIGATRPRKSMHRIMAMIVNSGTTIDPVTRREIKGKERMVFNYKSLNDNTYKDQYSLPGINTIIKRIEGAKIFSKFDLKSGFHQVAMDEESIPWTAFLVPGGLYEWLVMPFGLKNAPTVFQRKMDKYFKGTESFIAIYIDDILVISKNEKEHAKHLEKMLKICEDNGLVLSPTKMKIAVSTIDFLRVIGEGTIKLQPQIIKKIVNFNEEEIKTKKGLRSFLGILNYARNYITKLGILLRPLYEKTNAHGDKRLKPSDYELVRKIKEQVQNIPDLEIPPENAYIILKTDGCTEGWGGIVKWKKSKGDPRSSEKICAYASGKFSTTQSTIDAEINACINTLEKLKIYYLDKQEVTLRTDCQAIISFYNKTNSNKSSRVRWVKFVDAVTGTGVKINIEHIEGKHNTLADSLSRLVNLCFAECIGEMKQLAATALYLVEKVLQSPNAF
ncbi:Orf y [Tanacetum coccineum]